MQRSQAGVGARTLRTVGLLTRAWVVQTLSSCFCWWETQPKGLQLPQTPSLQTGPVTPGQQGSERDRGGDSQVPAQSASVLDLPTNQKDLSPGNWLGAWPCCKGLFSPSPRTGIQTALRTSVHQWRRDGGTRRGEPVHTSTFLLYLYPVTLGEDLRDAPLRWLSVGRVHWSWQSEAELVFYSENGLLIFLIT